MTTLTGPEPKSTQFTVYFSELADPRRTEKGNFHHLLSDILLLTISAMLCGASEWSLVRTFGKNQLEWLRKYGNFSRGIPSTDTLERVFAAIDAKSFNACFIKWIESVRQDIKGETISIDGKTMRGAKSNKNSKNMPHVVSAFAKQNGLCLGQVKTSEKSNEITAIPELLELLALKGCTVTIDAMGCQKDIAAKIIDKKADYILAVKGNQKNLEEAILDTLKLEKPTSIHKWDDVGHGRIETRTCKVFSNLSHYENAADWIGLKTFFVVESEVYKKSTGETTTETRSYISSHMADAKLLNEKTREHWAIENNLHWTLDVTFGEDASRKRNGQSPENFNIMLKSALTLLVNDTTPKFSKNSKRLKAALNQEYREKLLGF